MSAPAGRPVDPAACRGSVGPPMTPPRPRDRTARPARGSPGDQLRQSPARRPPLRPAAGPRARARRQIDLPPGPDLRRARGRRDPHFRAARRRRRARHRQGHAGARRQGRAHRRGRLAHSRGRGRGLADAGRRARFRQFRHRLPAGHGRGGGLPDHRDLRRRCLAAPAAHAAHPRSDRPDGGARGQRRGGRPAAHHAGGRARSDPDPLSHPGALGADQVRGAARRASAPRARPS